MPARAIGSATIAFGLISVPVDLYSSNESKTRISFNMMHKECGSRLKQQYICPKDGKVVTQADTVKGYEFSKDSYVLFTPEEIKSLEEKATNMIDIVEFVPVSAVRREFIEKVYYVGAGKGGDRAYGLLTAALAESGLAALGQYAVRGQQHLALVRAEGNMLMLEQLRYEDEVKPASDVPVPSGAVKPQEVAMAKMLIDNMKTDEFIPSKYRDTVRDRVLEAITRKVQGEDITQDVVEVKEEKVVDLMEALKASLAAQTKK
jgi:DNA end-binding protein Ku